MICQRGTSLFTLVSSSHAGNHDPGLIKALITALYNQNDPF